MVTSLKFEHHTIRIVVGEVQKCSYSQPPTPPPPSLLQTASLFEQLDMDLLKSNISSNPFNIYQRREREGEEEREREREREREAANSVKETLVSCITISYMSEGQIVL